MSKSWENPFENLPEDEEKKLILEKAIWESAKPLESGDKSELKLKTGSRKIQGGFGKTVDKSIAAVAKSNVFRTEPLEGGPITKALNQSLTPEKIDLLFPKEEDKDDQFIKGAMPNNTEEARKEHQKKQDIQKPYA